MELRDGRRVVREFEVALGLQPKKRKRKAGDYRTPVGKYYVSDKSRNSRFHRFVGISYPNIEDAERGYQKGLIDVAHHGGGYNGEKSLYAISDRWRKYGTPKFEFKTMLKDCRQGRGFAADHKRKRKSKLVVRK